MPIIHIQQPHPRPARSTPYRSSIPPTRHPRHPHHGTTRRRDITRGACLKTDTRQISASLSTHSSQNTAHPGQKPRPTDAIATNHQQAQKRHQQQPGTHQQDRNVTARMTHQQRPARAHPSSKPRNTATASIAKRIHKKVIVMGHRTEGRAAQLDRPASHDPSATRAHALTPQKRTPARPRDQILIIRDPLRPDHHNTVSIQNTPATNT